MSDIAPKLNNDNFNEKTFEPVETVPVITEQVPVQEEQQLESDVETSQVEMPTKQTDEAKKFQSIADQRLAMAEREKVLREQAEKKAKELEEEIQRFKNPPKVEESLIEPIEPIMPDDYDEFEAVSDPKSSSAQYKRQYDKYSKEIRGYQTKLIKEMQSETKRQREEREKQEQEAIFKAKALGELSQLTGDDKEAQEIFNWAQTQPNSMENLVKMYKAEKGKPITQSKTPLAIPPNLGAISGGAEKPKSVDDEFNNSIKPIKRTYL